MKAITDMLHGYIKKVCFSARKAKEVFKPKAVFMLTSSFRESHDS